MSFTATILLSVGDGVTSDYVDLGDVTKYLLVSSGFSAPPPKPGDPYRTITVTLYITDATSSDTVWANYRAIEEKLYQARRATGPYGILSGVTLGVQFNTTEMTYFDVVDGNISLPNPAYSTIYANWVGKATLTLTCYPLGRGSEQELTPSGFLTNGIGATYYVANIPGDEDPLTRLQITDCSLNETVINRVRVGHRSLPGLASTDFVPFIDIAPAAPGTPYADTTATGGTCARLGTATTSWQTIGQVTQPSAAIKSTGLFDTFARVRDGSVAYSLPTGLTATQSKIVEVQAANASANTSTSLNLVWPAPTTAGNYLALAVTWTSARTITVPSAWGSPVVSGPQEGSGGTGGACAIWAIPNGASTSGTVTVTANGTCALIGTLIEYAGVASVSPLDLSATNGSTGGTPTVSTGTSTNQDYEEVLAVVWAYTTATVGAPAGWTNVTALKATDGLYISTGIVADTTQTAKVVQSYTPTGIASVGFSAAILTLKGVLTEAGSLSGSGAYAVVPVSATGDVGGASDTASVTFTQSNSGALLSWTAPATGGTPDHYLIYASNGATWSYTSTGAGANGTTYQVTSTSGWTAAIGPPSSATGLSNWRAGIGLSSGEVLLFGPEVTSALGNGEWEIVNLGAVPLPPTVAPDGADPLPWTVVVQGSNQTATPTLDVDFVATLPHDEPQWHAAFQDSAGDPMNLTTPRVWQFDSRRDERQSAVLYGAPVALASVGVTNNNDSTVTVSAGTALVNVANASDAILTPGQWWFAAYLLPTFASTAPPANAPVLLQWGTGANEVGCNFSGGYWNAYSVAASTNTSASVAASFAANTGHTVLGYANPTTLGVAFDSTTFTTHAAGGTPALSGGTVTIGNAPGGSYPITAKIGWIVMGTGVPSAADWSYLAGLGATDPNPLSLSAGAALTLCWHATRTDYAMNAEESGFVPVLGITRLGRGGNVIGVMADTAGGQSDIANTRFTLSLIVTPRYRLLTGTT